MTVFVFTQSKKFIRDHDHDRDAGCDHGAECDHDHDHDHDHDEQFYEMMPFYTSCYILSKEKKINSIIKLYLNNNYT